VMMMSVQTLSRCALPSGGSVGMHEVGAWGVRLQRRGRTGVSSGARLCSMAARGLQVMEVLWAEAGCRNEARPGRSGAGLSRHAGRPQKPSLSRALKRERPVLI